MDGMTLRATAAASVVELASPEGTSSVRTCSRMTTGAADAIGSAGAGSSSSTRKPTRARPAPTSPASRGTPSDRNLPGFSSDRSRWALGSVAVFQASYSSGREKEGAKLCSGRPGQSTSSLGRTGWVGSVQGVASGSGPPGPGGAWATVTFAAGAGGSGFQDGSSTSSSRCSPGCSLPKGDSIGADASRFGG